MFSTLILHNSNCRQEFPVALGENMTTSNKKRSILLLSISLSIKFLWSVSNQHLQIVWGLHSYILLILLCCKSCLDYLQQMINCLAQQPQTSSKIGKYPDISKKVTNILELDDDLNIKCFYLDHKLPNRDTIEYLWLFHTPSATQIFKTMKEAKLMAVIAALLATFWKFIHMSFSRQTTR